MATANEFFNRKKPAASKAQQASSSSWMRRAAQAKKGGNPPPETNTANITPAQWLRQQWNQAGNDSSGFVQGTRSSTRRVGEAFGLHSPSTIQQTGQFSGFGQGGATSQLPGQFQGVGMPGLATQPVVLPYTNGNKPRSVLGTTPSSNRPNNLVHAADFDLVESLYGTQNRWLPTNGLTNAVNPLAYLFKPGGLSNFQLPGPGQPKPVPYVPNGMSLYDYSYTPPAAPAEDYGYGGSYGGGGGGYGDYGYGGGGGYDYTPPVPTWYLNMLNWNIARRS